MAVKLLFHGLDLNRNEIQNARIHNAAAAPGTPGEGQVYWNTTAHALYAYDGTSWITYTFVGSTNILAETVGAVGSNGTSAEAARVDHVHAMPGLATNLVDGFMPATDKAKLDAATATNTASTLVMRDANGRTQVSTPSAANDAVNKAYVDNLASGLSWKQAVVAATTGNINLSNPGTDTFDTVTLAQGERLLVRAQTLPAENGIYIFDTSTTALTRATDADTWDDLVSAAVFISEGSAYDDTAWVCTVDAGGTLGTTAVTWVQFSGGAGLTAGTAIDITGNTVSVKYDNDTIKVNGSNELYADISGLGYATSIGDGAASSFVVTHNLNTLDVVVCVYDNATLKDVGADIHHTSVNSITVDFGAYVPTAAQFRVVVK